MVLCIRMFDIMSRRTTKCRRPRSMAPGQHSDPTKKSPPPRRRGQKNASLFCNVLMPYRPHIDSIGQAFEFGRNRFVPRQGRDFLSLSCFSPVGKVVQRWCSETSIYIDHTNRACVTGRARPTLGMIAALREQGPRSKNEAHPWQRMGFVPGRSHIQ